MSDDALSIAEFEALIGGRVESIRPLSHGEPMPITREYLEGEIASLQQQRQQAIMVAQQADGAIAAYQALLAKLDQVAQPTDPAPSSDMTQATTGAAQAALSPHPASVDVQDAG